MSAAGIIIGILVIGLIVFVHEFGHFLIARKNGVNVPEFCSAVPASSTGSIRRTTKRTRRKGTARTPGRMPRRGAAGMLRS